MVYQLTADWGRAGIISGNHIIAPRSAGIYQAGMYYGTSIIGNYIASQGPDTLDTTLPKGGIVLNGGNRSLVANNTIINTTRDGVYWTPAGVPNSSVKITGNIIVNARHAVHMQSAFNNSSNVSVDNNLISEAVVAGIKLDTYNSATLTGISIRGNQIKQDAGFGIWVESKDGSFQLAKCYITGNVIDAPVTTINYSGSFASAISSLYNVPNNG